MHTNIYVYICKIIYMFETMLIISYFKLSKFFCVNQSFLYYMKGFYKIMTSLYLPAVKHV